MDPKSPPAGDVDGAPSNDGSDWQEVKEKRLDKERTKMRIAGIVLLILGVAEFGLDYLQNRIVQSSEGGLDKTTLSGAFSDITDPFDKVLSSVLSSGITTFVALYSSAAEYSKSENNPSTLKVYSSVTTIAFVLGQLFALISSGIVSLGILFFYKPLFKLFGNKDLIPGAVPFLYYSTGDFFLSVAFKNFFSYFLFGDFKMFAMVAMSLASTLVHVTCLFTIARAADDKLLAVSQIAVIGDVAWILMQVVYLWRSGFFYERRFRNWSEVLRNARRTGGLSQIANKGLWLLLAATIGQGFKSVHGFQRRSIGYEQNFAWTLSSATTDLFNKFAKGMVGGLTLVLLPRLYSGRLFKGFVRIIGLTYKSVVLLSIGGIICALFMPGFKRSSILDNSDRGKDPTVIHYFDAYFVWNLISVPFMMAAEATSVLLLVVDQYKRFACILITKSIVFGGLQTAFLAIFKDLRYSIFCDTMGDLFVTVISGALFYGISFKKFKLDCARQTTDVLVDEKLKESFSSAVGLLDEHEFDRLKGEEADETGLVRGGNLNYST